VNVSIFLFSFDDFDGVHVVFVVVNLLFSPVPLLSNVSDKLQSYWYLCVEIKFFSYI